MVDRDNIIKQLLHLKGYYREDFDDYSIGVKDGIDFAIDAINKEIERGDFND